MTSDRRVAQRRGALLPVAHQETGGCGYNRNASHSAGHYVCECGWEDWNGTERRRDSAPQRPTADQLQDRGGDAHESRQLRHSGESDTADAVTGAAHPPNAAEQKAETQASPSVAPADSEFGSAVGPAVPAPAPPEPGMPSEPQRWRLGLVDGQMHPREDGSFVYFYDYAELSAYAATLRQERDEARGQRADEFFKRGQAEQERDNELERVGIWKEIAERAESALAIANTRNQAEIDADRAMTRALAFARAAEVIKALPAFKTRDGMGINVFLSEAVDAIAREAEKGARG